MNDRVNEIPSAAEAREQAIQRVALTPDCECEDDGSGDLYCDHWYTLAERAIHWAQDAAVAEALRQAVLGKEVTEQGTIGLIWDMVRLQRELQAAEARLREG